MLLDSIRRELARLELHPVNLGVNQGDGDSVTLAGSLLSYWKLPRILDGSKLLGVLQTLPDAAGPERVMNALCVAQAASETGTRDGSAASKS